MIKKMTAKSIRKIIYLFVAAIVCALTTITAFCNKCEVNAASEAGYLYYTSDFSGGYSYFDSSYEWWKHIVDGLSLRFVSDYVVPANCEVTNNINIDLNGITLKQNSIKLNANINVYDYKGGGKGLFTIGKNSSVSFVGSANSLVDANVDENANFRVESGRIVFLYFLNDHAYINSVLPEKCCFVAHYATGKDELYPYESGKVPLFNGTTSSSDITYLSVEKCHHKMIKNNVCVYCNTTIDSTEALRMAQAELEEAKAELVEKIETKAGKDELTQAISDLNAAIDTAKTTSNTYADTQDTALKEELTQTIETAKTEAVNAAKTLVDEAKAELVEKIETKAGKDELTQAISDLNAAIDTAKTTSNTYADTQDEQLKTELIQSIETAKTEAMSAAKTLIDDAKAELVEKIETKASKDELTQAISDLNAAIDTAKTTSNTYADTQDEELKTELEQKILEAKTALQGAINSISERLEQIETKNNKNSEEIKSLKIATYISLGVVFVLSMAMVVMVAVLKYGIRNGVKKNKSN